MPLFRTVTLTKFQKAKAYAVANKLDYFASYHLLRWARQEDGDPLGKEHPDMPALADMPADVQSAVSAGQAAVNAA